MKYGIKFFETDGTPMRGGIMIELLGDGKSLGRTPIDAEGVAAFEIDPTQYRKLAVRVPQDHWSSTGDG